MLVQAIEQARSDAKASGQVTSAQVFAIEQLLAEGKSGKRVELGGGISAWREFNELVFVYGDPPSPVARDLNEPGATRGAVQFGGVTVSVERRIEPCFLERARAEARLSRQGGRDWLIALIDEAELPDRLVVRARREGDRAGVLGQSGNKRLKSLMIDHRIPSSRRATWPIVTTPDDRYVWSPGLPPARDFAVRDGTPIFAILRASIL
jgi:tRNA(Ile)-lysidine synthetase-like protein